MPFMKALQREKPFVYKIKMEKEWTKEKRIEFLRNNPAFWSRLGIVTTPPVVERGKLICRENVELNVKRHKTFYEQGVLLHSFILPLGWIGVGKYDYVEIERILIHFFKELPDAYILPRIKLDPPIEWLLENPEDAFVFEGGSTDLAEIRKSVENSRHPINGAVFDGYTGLQSFSSRKWWQDAGEALRKLIIYLKATPFANRIVGYHLAYGCCGETTRWGSWEEDWTHRGDFGVSAKRDFENYLREKDYPIIEIPSTQERYRIQYLHDLRSTEQEIVYSQFLSDSNVDAMEFFAKVVRQLEPEKPTGYFYGYQLEVADCSHAGHAALERVLQSEYIDFLAGPKGYHRASPYDPGVGQAPTQSIGLKKLWIDEVDNRTHLCKDTDKKAHVARDLAQTKCVYWREFIKNLSNKQGFWIMDLGGGWFDDAEIMNEIKYIIETNTRLRSFSESSKSVSEVLIVYDDAFFHQVKTELKLYHALMPKALSIMKESGTPIDIYRLCDLENLPLNHYKVIVFLNCIAINGQQMRDTLLRIDEQAHIMWQYVPGLISDEKYDINNVISWTGMQVEEIFDEQYSYPIVKVVSEKATILKKNSKGDAIMAYTYHSGRKNILNTLPDTLTVEDFRSVLKDAGVHLYSSGYSTVQATNQYIYVTAGRDITEPIRLREARRCKELFSNTIFEKTKELKINVAAGTGVFIEYIE